MERTTSPTSQLIHQAWPVLVAQLAMMANAVIDTAMGEGGGGCRHYKGKCVIVDGLDKSKSQIGYICYSSLPQ